MQKNCYGAAEAAPLQNKTAWTTLFAKAGFAGGAVEAGARDVGESVDDGAIFGGAVGELDVAGDVGAAQTWTDDVGLGDAADAGWSDGDAEACSDEGENGEPLRSFLDDVRAEAVLFAEGDGFVVGEGSGSWGEEDEGFVAKLRG
jgi:hypothetical protein